jgi:biotin carboxyl carrier protein
VTFFGPAWRIALPVAVILASSAILVAVLRSRGTPRPIWRSGSALIVFVGMRLTIEAALGSHRPASERQWKGVAAALLIAAGAAHLWKRRHREPVPPPPEATGDAGGAPATGADVGDGGVVVRMPTLGADVTDAQVTRWHKQIGDRVEPGEPLADISTGKVDTEIPATTAGELRQIVAPSGSTVQVGHPIAVITPACLPIGRASSGFVARDDPAASTGDHGR